MVSIYIIDMHHTLIELIRKEDPFKIHKAIQEHFKGGKSYHVEAARKKLNAHRLGPDIERGLFKSMERISDLEVPQKMEMLEKFGILREGPREMPRPTRKILILRSRKLKRSGMHCRRQEQSSNGSKHGTSLNR